MTQAQPHPSVPRSAHFVALGSAIFFFVSFLLTSNLIYDCDLYAGSLQDRERCGDRLRIHEAVATFEIAGLLIAGALVAAVWFVFLVYLLLRVITAQLYLPDLVSAKDDSARESLRRLASFAHDGQRKVTRSLVWVTWGALLFLLAVGWFPELARTLPDFVNDECQNRIPRCTDFGEKMTVVRWAIGLAIEILVAVGGCLLIFFGIVWAALGRRQWRLSKDHWGINSLP